MSYQLLSARSAQLSLSYPDDKTWDDSPFNWIRNKASAIKGSVGRDFAATLIASAGFEVARQGMALIVNNLTLRVKLSLMGEDGTLIFEQIKNDDFEHLICIGLYPQDCFGWMIPKEELIVNGNLQERTGLAGQHIGDTEASDFWLKNLNAHQPFEWLKPYGGTSNALVRVIQNTL